MQYLTDWLTGSFYKHHSNKIIKNLDFLGTQLFLNRSLLKC
jgi:hypothetical protein